MYNKLFTKILDSSIWMEDTPTRLVWITFLAVMDEEGMCQFASVANLAHRARLTVAEAEAAVKCLEGEDAHSSDPEFEGRRIEHVPGGWIVLNADKYRKLVTREVARERTRERVARFREKKRAETHGNGRVAVSNAPVTPKKRRVTPSDAVAGAETEEPLASGGVHQQFIDGWMGYYEKRYGAKYAFQGGRDGKAIKTLLGHFETADKAKAFIGKCHAREGEGYPFANTKTLSEIANNISKLQAALSRPAKVNGNGHAIASRGPSL